MSAKRVARNQARAGAGGWSAWEDDERRYTMRDERLRRAHARQRMKQQAWSWWPDDDAESVDATEAPRRGERRWAGS